MRTAEYRITNFELRGKKRKKVKGARIKDYLVICVVNRALRSGALYKIAQRFYPRTQNPER